jgi:hypothetical protein
MTRVRTGLSVAFTAALIGVCAWGGAAHADLIKRRMLLESCTSPSATTRADCSGYIAGLADAYSDRDTGNANAVCLPAGVKLSQVREKVVPYLQSHRSTPDAPAADWVREALHAAYPCSK